MQAVSEYHTTGQKQYTPKPQAQQTQRFVAVIKVEGFVVLVA